MLELIGFLAVLYIFYEWLQSKQETPTKLKEEFIKAKNKISK